MSTESRDNESAVEPEVVVSGSIEPAGTGVGLATPDGQHDIDLATADDEDLESEDSLTFSNGVIEKIVASPCATCLTSWA